MKIRIAKKLLIKEVHCPGSTNLSSLDKAIDRLSAGCRGTRAKSCPAWWRGSMRDSMRGIRKATR